MKEKEQTRISRREFLSVAAVAGVAGTVGMVPAIAACTPKGPAPLKAPGTYYLPTLTDKALDGRPLKAGLIGCGGRGSGAVENLLEAANDVTITALADTFPDQIKKVNANLQKKYGYEVPAEQCFSGFDAYQKVIDSGIDVVLVCTPPAFRPEHFRYATAKGIHSFLEKPLFVDVEGYRSIMATAKQAASKGLNVLTGTQRHHSRAYVAAYKQIMNGMIGRITSGNIYWNGGELWYRTREEGWSDMEWMIRDWVNWRWLSGDHIVEQHVHNIDVFSWFSGLKPVQAIGMGSRQRRPTGDQFDNFSIDFEFENGVHVHSMCRQIHGCSNQVAEFIQGTRGSWEGTNKGDHIIRDLDGNILWQYIIEEEEAPLAEGVVADGKTTFQQFNPFTLEHVNWITHIRKGGEPIMFAEETALSTLMAVMGRESAYTGQTVTWEEITNMQMDLLPAELSLHAKMNLVPQIPVPGKEKPATEIKKRK